MNKIFLYITLSLLFSSRVISNDSHEHDSKEIHQSIDQSQTVKEKDHDHEEDGKDDHDDHDDHDEHGDHDDHDEGGGKAIGEGKAIISNDEKLGIKLAADSLKTLGVRSRPIGAKELMIPRSALIQIKGESFVYRLRSDFFKLLKVNVTKTQNDQLSVSLAEFQSGDQVVVNGADLIRISDVYANDSAHYGHSH